MSDSPPLIDPAKLQARRIRARLNQPALARRAGLSKATISRIEKGKQAPAPQTLGALADALGCDIEDLMPDKVAA